MESFQDRLIAALQETIPNSKCPLCQTSDWEVSPGTFTFRQHVRAGGSESIGNALPSAALVCKFCGNTQFINLLIYGNKFKGDF
jgi:hypothetical protein